MGILHAMSDSWPASPRGDDASDSLAGQAFEVERALKALEAVDAFRAEAAALRAELQAARASGTLAGRRARRRPGLGSGSAVPEAAWRLAAECAVIIGAAVVAWAVHLGRVGILLTLGGTWLVVAVFEAVASRSSQPRWVPPPSPAVSLPPVRALAAPATPATGLPEIPEPVAEEVGWPSRLEPVEAEPVEAEPEPEPALEAEPEPEAPPEPLLEAEPEPEPVPEPEPQAEPVVYFPEIEPDGGPSAGAYAVLEEAAELLDGAARRRRWWPHFRKREKLEPLEAVQLEPAAEPDLLEPEPEAEPDDGPSIGEVAAPEEREEPEETPQQPPRQWRPFRDRSSSAGLLDSEPLDAESEAEPLELLHQESEADLRDPAYGWSSQLGTVDLSAQPEAEAEEEVLFEPEPEPEQRSRGWRMFSRGLDAPSDSEVAPSEAEPVTDEPEQELIAALDPEPEPVPVPVVYAFSAIEPDGGPSVGAFTLLEEAAVLPMQPVFDSPLSPRVRRLRLRRRRRVRS